MSTTLPATGLSRAPARRYPAILRTVHWLTVLAVAAAYLLVELGDDDTPIGPASAIQWHYLAGVLVLVLLAIRLPALAASQVPPVTPAPGRWVHLAARATHLTLYGFLLLQPVLGILQVNFGGDPVRLPVVDLALPMVVSPDHAWEERIEEWHEALGQAFYWVIGLHVAAALWHHFIVRDDTLRRML